MTTILLVDDLSDNRRFLSTVLGHQGYRLVEATNGLEGIAAARAEPFDLVITDVLMPVMDGYEFVRELRQDPATRAIPVVFYTAHYGAREARALARSIGVSDVLTKPASSVEVLEVVGRLLANEPLAQLPTGAKPVTTEFDREHLRLLTDKVSEKAAELRRANARLRALINIGLEFAAEPDTDRMLQRACEAACDLFGATYATIGILGRDDRTVEHFVSKGAVTAEWLKLGDSISGLLRSVVIDRRTIRGSNPGGDPSSLQLPRHHPDVHAFLVAPIASSMRVHGWICLVNNEGQAFAEDDEPMVLALAGQIGRVYELEHQILERRRADSAARHERDQAQQYLDAAEVILLALDGKGRITLVNRYACSLLGRTAEELVGRDFIDTCVPARIRDETRNRLRNVHAGPVSSIVDNAIVTSSGEERMIEWRNTVLRDDDGRVLGTLSSGTDLTDRSRAIEAVRAGDERTAFALRSAGVGIWDMDYTTGVLRWSETIEAQYGLKPGTFPGTFEAFVERIHPDDRELVLEAFGRAIRAGDDFSVAHRSIWPDGTVRWLSGSGRIHLGERGQPVRGTGISLDVTEQRLLEDQLRQAQKLEAIGQLAGGVAHDFNNVLTSILGFSHLVLSGLPPDNPLRADVVEIKRGGERAASLVRQLLAFSRQQILQPKVLNINTIISNTEAMLKRLIRENVSMKVSLRPDIGQTEMDPTQIEQILVNLVVNAADAMPNGGKLTIETGNVRLDEHYRQHHLPVTPGDYVMLAVSDTGLGMDETTSRRIFEPFFTTKGVGKGTGLGLSTVHGIVKQSGGDIWVYSEPGHGTTFKIFLPQVAAGLPMAIEPVSEVGAWPRGSETILLVEDDDAVRLLACVTLGRTGYEVIEAANPKEAMRLVGEWAGPIHLLLSDVIMPESEGPPLLERVTKLHPSIKVLYMSGYADEAIIRHAVLSEAVPFLQKPFTPSTLARKIRDVLEHSDAPAIRQP